ncbi:MAG: flagellar basal body rod protein FlgC [Treponemataceae bacterium]|nr:MAG: flagellar basal body rod protein FlgC [Treponemataceae bacterium]
MGMFSSINIAATGMSAERLRTDVISDNIANASTTRTQDGTRGPYLRRKVILKAVGEQPVFSNPFVPKEFDGVMKGVKVHEILTDRPEDAKTRFVYDPTHPDAILTGERTGYVEYPDVNIVNEMVDLISASRAYEANATVIQGAKEMFSAALEIGR